MARARTRDSDSESMSGILVSDVTVAAERLSEQLRVSGLCQCGTRTRSCARRRHSLRLAREALSPGRVPLSPRLSDSETRDSELEPESRPWSIQPGLSLRAAASLGGS